MITLKFSFARSTVLVLLTTNVLAAPFDTGFIEWTQPSGTPFIARVWGDEFFSWMETQDGYRVVRGSGGWYYYAMLDAEGDFTATQLRVAVDVAPAGSYKLERSQEAIATIRNRIVEFSRQIEWRHQYFMEKQAIARTLGQPVRDTLGVILVEFQDVKHFGYPSGGYFKATSDSMFFSQNYWVGPIGNDIHPEGEQIFGSMRDYYWQMSRPNRDSVPPYILTGRVVNPPNPNGIPRWIRLDHDRDYYLGLPDFDESLALEAIAKGRDSGWIAEGEFSAYTVVYAREAISRGALKVHAHPGSPAYVLMAERAGSGLYGSSPSFAHIGVHCHEFGHLLGFPDEYCEYPEFCQGTDVFSYDLMSFGIYNGPSGKGECPATLAPYHRIKKDWVRVTAVTSDETNFLVQYNYHDPQLYRINPRNAIGNEHFLFETRLRQGFDLYLPNAPANFNNQPGTLLIWHHDAYRPEDPQNPDRIDLVEADNSESDFLKDFFPNDRLLNIQSFSDTSEAAPILGNGEFAHIALLGIRRTSNDDAIIDQIKTFLQVDFTIRTNTTWSGARFITDDVNVVNGATLTLSPGAQLIFRSPQSHLLALYVQDNSKLTARGTSAVKVTLRSFSGGKGTWDGLQTSGTGQMDVSSCVIRDASKAISNMQTGASLHDVRIENCTSGITADAKTMTLVQCSFILNANAVSLKQNADAEVSECFFDRNFMSINIQNSTAQIHHNIFTSALIDPHQSEGFTDISLGENSSPEIFNNLFKGPRDFSRVSSQAIFMDAYFNIQPVIKNNTITDYKICCLALENKARPLVKNNIFYLNYQSTFDNGSIQGEGSLTHNNIYNEDRDSYDPPPTNIELDPSFVDPLSQNFALRYFSPSIDAGDPADPYDQEREPNGARINQGHHGNTPQATRSFNIVASGSISENTDWGGNVLVESDVTVDEPATLNVTPGTTVWVSPKTAIDVVSNMTAIGDAPYNVVFKADNAEENWSGILLRKVANESIVRYCSISGALTGLTIEATSPTIYNNLIENCSVGLDIYTIDAHAQPVINNNEIRNCKTGMYFHQAFPTEVSSNFVHNNDIGIFTFQSSPVFHNNISENNQYFGVWSEDADPRFGDNVADDRGCNTVRNNTTVDGTADLYAAGGSPFLGYFDGSQSYGGYNTVASDFGPDPPRCVVVAENDAFVLAHLTWWGQSPPDERLFCMNGGKVDYSKPLDGEPVECEKTFAQWSLPQDDEELILQTALVDRGHRNYTPALGTYGTFITGRPNSIHARRALREMRQTYRDFQSWSHDTTLQAELISRLGAISTNHPNTPVRKAAFALWAEELHSKRDWNGSIAKYQQIIQSQPNTDYERGALYSLFSIEAYGLRDTTAARSVLTTLRTKYPADPHTRLAQIRYAVLTKRGLQPGTRAERRTPQPESTLPQTYALEQNFPNPFNPTTVIRYQLPEDVTVSLRLYDLLGREVVTLVNQLQKAGYYAMPLQATGLASGVYFYRLDAGSFSSVKKLMILK